MRTRPAWSILRRDPAKLPPVFEEIQGVAAYFDTVEISLKKRPTSPYIDALRCYSGNAVPWRNPYSGTYTLTVSQPSEKALRLLSTRKHAYNPRVRRVDVSLDLFTATVDDALELQRQIAYRLDPLRVRKPLDWRPPEAAHPTAYIGRTKSGTTSWAIYGDLPSKLNGLPCCHVEPRANGMAIVRRMLRIDEGVDVYADQLIDLDPAAFFRDRFRLSTVDTRGALFAGRVMHLTPGSIAPTGQRRLPSVATATWRAWNFGRYFWWNENHDRANAFVVRNELPFSLPTRLSYAPPKISA